MNVLQALGESPVIQRLGWTLLHSLWQASAVAALLALVLPALRKCTARTAYAACCGALLLVVVLPAMTFALLPESSIIGTAGKEAAPDRPAPRTNNPTTAPQTDGGSPAVTPGPSPAAEGVTALWGHLTSKLPSWIPWIVLIWSHGVSGLSLWNLGGWMAVQRLKSKAARPVSLTIQESAARIARQLGLVRTVRLLQSALVDSPIVIGAVRPVILLPASLVSGLPLDQLETLLAHELAHVLRQDYLVNLLQRAVETLMFYHPAVWWISSQVRIEREHCCDDIAVGFAADRVVYVKALAACAEARGQNLVPAATGGLLLPRIRRLMGISDPRNAHPSGWLTTAVVLVFCASAIAGYKIHSPPATAETIEETRSVNGVAGQTEREINGGGVDLLDGEATKRQVESTDERITRAGVPVFGQDMGNDGQPIAGAKVALGQDVRNFEAHAKTGADGMYRIEQLPEGDCVLTVLKIGLAPHMQTVVVSKTADRFDIMLQPGINYPSA